MNAATKTNYKNNTNTALANSKTACAGMNAIMLTKSQRWMRQVASGLALSLCLSLLAVNITFDWGWIDLL